MAQKILKEVSFSTIRDIFYDPNDLYLKLRNKMARAFPSLNQKFWKYYFRIAYFPENLILTEIFMVSTKNKITVLWIIYVAAAF